MKKDTLKWFIILHVIVLIFSVNSVCMKKANEFPKFSTKYIMLYAIAICLLGFYAIAWQQVLKHLPLITTYANKAVTTLWGLIWGYLIFHEKVTVYKVVGALVVILGVYFVASGDEEVNGKSSNQKQEVNDNA